MSSPEHKPIQISVSHNRIQASWVDGTAIWSSDYYSHEDPAIETMQFERRKRILAQFFERYKLVLPTVEVLDMAERGRKESASKMGAQLLRVTTYVIPYVDDRYLLPVVELRLPASSPEEVGRSLIVNDLNKGGQAIYTAFGGSMTPRHK